MSAKAKVKLNGGPRDGEWIDYYTPLPKVLAVPYQNDSKTTQFADYQREGTREYRYKRG